MIRFLELFFYIALFSKYAFSSPTRKHPSSSHISHGSHGTSSHTAHGSNVTSSHTAHGSHGTSSHTSHGSHGTNSSRSAYGSPGTSSHTSHSSPGTSSHTTHGRHGTSSHTSHSSHRRSSGRSSHGGYSTSSLRTSRVNHTSNHAPSHWKVVYAGVPFRHGIRDASNTVTFTSKDQRTWSRGPGELTLVGEEGMRTMGKQLKKRYASLLGKPTKSDIRAFSTAWFKRNAESTRFLLEGLYGENHREIEIINLQVRWLTSNRKFLQEKEKVSKSNDYKEFAKKVMEYVKAKLLHIKELRSVEYLDENYNTFVGFVETMLCEHANGVKLHPEILEQFDLLHRMKYWGFVHEVSQLLFIQGRAASYISDIVQSIKNVVKGERSVPKLEIFCTHESNIIAIMRALDPAKPFDGYFRVTYGVSIIFELRKSDRPHSHSGKNYIVKVFYNSDWKLNRVKDVSLRGCKHGFVPEELAQQEPFCYLDEFYQVTKPYTMDKYEYFETLSGQECKNENDLTRLTKDLGLLNDLIYQTPVIPV